MSPQDFDLSVSHLARSSCHSKMVLQQFSCSAILPHHSQHLVCICSNISQNVEGLRSIPISLHIQTAISHQCRNSLSMSPFQFFNSLKTVSHMVRSVYVLVAYLQFRHQWFDTFQCVENDREWQNVFKWSRCHKNLGVALASLSQVHFLLCLFFKLSKNVSYNCCSHIESMSFNPSRFWQTNDLFTYSF